MAAAAGFLSGEQFEQLYTDDQKPYFEYWFGEAIQKPVPTTMHGAVQWALAILLARQGWKGSLETRLKLSKMAFPVPDAIASLAPLRGPYPTEPFELCIEILSPNDRLTAAFAKAAHYLDWGIGWVWIIDPMNRLAYLMSAEIPQPRMIGLSESLTAGPEGRQLTIAMSELFAEVDENTLKP